MSRMDRWAAAGSGRLMGAAGRGRLWALVGLCLGLAACGGDVGGGAAGDGAPAALGLVKVTVSDAYGTGVAGATVLGPQGPSTTDAMGAVLVPLNSPDGTATVTVSRETFVDKSLPVTSTPGQVNEVNVTLDRATSAAGGSLTSRSGVMPTVNGTGQQLSFEIELVVVDGNSQPIENLTQADFALRACTPDPATAKIDCVRGSGTDADLAYAPALAKPDTLALVAGQVARPYATALLLDQSGSIRQTDPTGAKLFSSKAFLDGLGADNHALLSAFASGASAVIPTPPLTVYGPFRAGAAATEYFPTLDSLASLVGGDTPLYQSIDALRQQVVSDASLPAGIARAMIVFTDGEDTDCDGRADRDACRVLARERSIQLANQDQVRLFTIGLSSGVDIAALGELANKTGGAMLYADNAEQLLPLYGSVGKLLSLSLPTYRLRWTVQAASAGAFRSGQSLLGRVQVTTANRTFDVPFIVGVP